MSTAFENLADSSAALVYSDAEMKRRRPSGKKVYKPKLATKVRWALEDVMERTDAAQGRMRRILELFDELWMLEGVDARVRAHQGRLEHELYGLSLDVAEMARIAQITVKESRRAAE